MDLKWTHIDTANLPGISPKMEKLCDLGRIIDPAKRAKFSSDDNPALHIPQDQTTFSFDVEVIPSTLNHIIGPGQYCLKIIVGAANSNPVERTLKINLSGKWYSDEQAMFTNGILISPL